MLNINQTCKSGFDFVLFSFLITCQQNNPTLEPPKSSNTYCFCEEFSIFNRSRVVKLATNSSPNLALCWYTIYKHRLPKRYKSVSFCRSILTLQWFRFRLHVRTHLEAFGRLLASKTNDGSKGVALLLCLHSLCSLETYFDIIWFGLLNTNLSTITNTSHAVLVTLLKHRDVILVLPVTIRWKKIVCSRFGFPYVGIVCSLLCCHGVRFYFHYIIFTSLCFITNKATVSIVSCTER